MVMRIEERFALDEIEDEDVQELQTVGEVVDYLEIMPRNQMTTIWGLHLTMQGIYRIIVG